MILHLNRQSSISDAKRRCSIPADWFLKLYRSHGLDPDWLSEGVEPVYINDAKAKIPADTLLKETPAPYGKMNSRSRVVPVSTMAGANKEAAAWEPKSVEELSVPESFCRPKLQVVKNDSASMAPVIGRGAFVGIDCNQKEHPDGDLCAVYFPHQGLTIRRVFMQGDTFLLKAENGQYSDLTIPAAEMTERTVGRVIWVLQNLSPM
ncbi:S24 family peptidase [uncultured Pseudodesulfovibrio sp.]|uniref:S24 family peptidase n=1 Tax=uncultured Pseudodesulfovibrio sp. TaxID=2035858 RepID=UPI0029C888D9|nr:S24 family peptidase [uncultured Pseudodesulfovibrio sp.]